MMPRINKDEFVTETFVTLTKFGDFLVITESSLEQLKRSGLDQIVKSLGTDGRPAAGPAKQMFNSHRKRFDRDLCRVLRYSALMSLYSLFETTARNFVEDFEQSYPGKPQFKIKKPPGGFVKHFQHWLKLEPTSVELDNPRIWNLLDDFRIIRNFITHANGDFSLADKPAEIREVVQRTRRVEFDSKDILTVDQDFAFEVSERIYTFFRMLFGKCGYQIALPEGHLEMVQKNFGEFESEITDAIKAYDMRQTVNLGGQLSAVK
jgi:hypothetical protein